MNTLKQHWYEALALPAIVATVWHTHTGMGFDLWLGWVYAVSISGTVWGAWFIVTSRTLRGKRWLWYAALVVSLSGSSIEGFLMYKSHGSIVDPAYTVEKADYDRKLGEYTQMRNRWATTQADAVAAIKAQMQEIKDTGKLTTRRTDMTDLTKQLEAANSKAAPNFAITEPVVAYQWNVGWLVITFITLISVPMTYLVIAGFRATGAHQLQENTVTVATVSPENATDRVTVDKTVTVTVDTEVNQTEGDENAPASAHDVLNIQVDNSAAFDGLSIIAAVARITALPLWAAFDCPVCAAATVKNRADRTTCGAAACRAKVKRAKQNNANVFTLRKPVVHTNTKGKSHAK